MRQNIFQTVKVRHSLDTSQINADVHKLCATVMLFVHLPREERATLLATLHAHADTVR